MLGEGIVDGNDGVAQDFVLSHGVEANYARGGFFGAADYVREKLLALGVQNGDEIRAVVHGDLRFVIERGHDVGVIDVVVFSLDGVNGDVVIADQAGGHVILDRKSTRLNSSHLGI